MILVDQKVLNVDNPTTDAEKWAVECIKEVKQRKDLVFSKGMIHDEQGGLQAPPTTFPLDVIRKDTKNGTNQRWMFTTSNPTWKNGKDVYRARRISVVGDLMVDCQNDPELGFFLLYLFQNSLSRMGYLLKDYDKEAEASNKKAALKAEAEYIILSKLKDNELKLLSFAWDIKDVAGKSVQVLKKELRDKVSLSDATKGKNQNVGRGYEEFIKDASSQSEELVLRAKVTKAFADDLMVFEKNKLKVTYKGGDAEPVCVVPPVKTNVYLDYVTSFLMENKNAREVFESVVSGTTTEKIVEVAKDYRHMTNNATLIKTANEYGVPDIKRGMKNEEIKAAIAAHLGETL